jgi:hypothetical protein
MHNSPIPTSNEAVQRFMLILTCSLREFNKKNCLKLKPRDSLSTAHISGNRLEVIEVHIFGNNQS